MSVQLNQQASLQATVIRSTDNSIGARPAKLTKLSVVFGFMVAFEFAIVAASTYFGSVLYHYASFEMLPNWKEYTSQALFIASVFTIASLGFRHFGMAYRHQLHTTLWSGIGAVALAFIIFLSAIFLLKISTNYSRGAFVIQIISVGIAICAFRAPFHMWLRSAIAAGVIEAGRVILIGNINDYSDIMKDFRSKGIIVSSTFSFPSIHETGETSDDGRMVALNNIDVRKVADHCRAIFPDDVVIFAAQNDLSSAYEIAKCLSDLPFNIHVAPKNEVGFLIRSQLAELGGVKTLQIAWQPLSATDLVIKRTFDIVVATVALIVLSPLLLITTIAIKLDTPGNVFYRQLRHGYNNRIIRVLKFRSMIAMEDGGKFTPATEDDRRVTRVGRILRRTSIDELPQLFNVLLGEMSIVGPRPHAAEHNKMFEDLIFPFARRHNVKPGITGWAQVNGHRGPACVVGAMQQRVNYDLYYIDNWSFFFDLKIILMTLFSKQTYKNAF